jgi:hypothetical protein
MPTPSRRRRPDQRLLVADNRARLEQILSNLEQIATTICVNINSLVHFV